METFLALNSCEIDASTEEQLEIILAVASGKLRRESFTEWLAKHLRPLS